MYELMTQVTFKRGLTAHEIQGLELKREFSEIHLASLGVWQDTHSLQYEVNDDLDFWFEDNHMVCPLRIHALCCSPKGERFGFYIPLYALPIKELVMEIPAWLAQKLPVDSFTQLRQIHL